MMFIHDVNAEKLYHWSGKMIRPFLTIAVVLFLTGLFFAFFMAPVDATQGQSYRIIYIHVPAAWMSLMLFVFMAMASLYGFVRGSSYGFYISQAIAQTGALMAIVALVSGAYWGRPTWGTYWVWDARLTSELILLFLYIGFMALHNAIEDKRRADKASGILSIVGVLNVPVVYFSVQWWNTLHQGASITSAGSSIATIMLQTMLIMVFAACFYSFAVILGRFRSIILEREHRARWARRAILEGEL